MRSRESSSGFVRSLFEVDPAVVGEVLDWMEQRRRAHKFDVHRIPFAELESWTFEQGTGDLAHKSGKFFRIEGIDVRTNFGPTPRWMQPIINQPEVGILGFLTKNIDGVLRLLVQAKMEPGNVNLIQLSPTVQATRSNYTQIHGGARPAYLEYFLSRGNGKVVADQLQSEQGARFYRKRNRNVIMEVPEGEDVQVQEDFRWLTLGELTALLSVDNVVNMDSRTVLSCIPLNERPEHSAHSFLRKVLTSASADDNAAEYSLEAIISWITELKINYELEVKRVGLNFIDGWSRGADAISHHSERFFSVIAVSVAASTREVVRWRQPLIESAKGGILSFICQMRHGILHFIVQGRVEPGNLDAVEMAPTLQCTPSNYDRDRPDTLPPFFDLVMNATTDEIRYDALQSEEGGRFYHDQNRYLIVEVPPEVELELPMNYTWMTVRQMQGFIRFNNYFNIEARGLLSCLPAAR